MFPTKRFWHVEHCIASDSLPTKDLSSATVFNYCHDTASSRGWYWRSGNFRSSTKPLFACLRSNSNFKILSILKSEKIKIPSLLYNLLQCMFTMVYNYSQIKAFGFCETKNVVNAPLKLKRNGKGNCFSHSAIIKEQWENLTENYFNDL